MDLIPTFDFSFSLTLSVSLERNSSNLLGAYGFIDAVKELKEQLIKMDLKIDYIFFASSSGGTQAGLKLGVDLFGLDIELIPISIDKLGYGDTTLDEAVLELLIEGQKKLGIKKHIQLKRLL